MPHPDPTRVDGAGTERPAVRRTGDFWSDVVAATVCSQFPRPLIAEQEHRLREKALTRVTACCDGDDLADVFASLDEARKQRDAARADAHRFAVLRRLFDREGLAVLAAPYDAPGVRITGCGTVAEGETLEAAVVALDAQLEARAAAKGATDGE